MDLLSTGGYGSWSLKVNKISHKPQATSCKRNTGKQPKPKGTSYKLQAASEIQGKATSQKPTQGPLFMKTL
jgi:hypothetical protein